jgi:hypothetical protein
VAGQTKVEEATQVQSSHPQVQAEIAVEGAAVAQLRQRPFGPISQAIERSTMGRCCR